MLKMRKIRSIIATELNRNAHIINSVSYPVTVNEQMNHTACNEHREYVPYISLSCWHHGKDGEKIYNHTSGITIYAGSILYICKTKKLDVESYTRSIMSHLIHKIATCQDPTYPTELQKPATKTA